MVGGGVVLGRYASSWAVFREGNVEQMAPKWLFIVLANSYAVFSSCPGMDILFVHACYLVDGCERPALKELKYF